MHLIVGLGNPGKKYVNTRHNAGFLVVEELANRATATFKTMKALKSEVAKGMLDDQTILIAKPTTYMNGSGEAVAALMNFYKIPLQQLIVVSDDADLSFGTIRVREQGSSGGQKGLQSVIETLGTNQFRRVRVGIGRPTLPEMPLDEWVLGVWSKEEKKNLPDVLAQAVKEVERMTYDIGNHRD